ncbi:hypothetical protein TEA_021876 [Camellia sinensis var. sinensis]|uniref:Dymeclin n=1 Tax=Camellia sinensis var. sinensis TaxID=542762 RepID=A0A4S4EUC7_CAMSN|nr:hypothetical protein TEA_021876 [Camellia sinensis var. sinensis]
MRVCYHGSWTLGSLVSFYDDVTGKALPWNFSGPKTEPLNGTYLERTGQLSDDGKNNHPEQESCPFSWARSPENLLQQETYLALATAFVLLRACGNIVGGTGFTTLGIIRRVDAKNVTILDQSPHQLAKAKQKEALKECKIVEGDAEDLPFGTDYADRYVSAGSIEYWPDPQRGIKEAYRLPRSHLRQVHNEFHENALQMAGISIVGRNYYGVFPLRGTLLNVRETSHKQIMENAEITSIKQILGLQHGKQYDSVKTLRYGHLMIMTDQDIYLHTNCLAILANMAPHVHRLSAYASQRLVSLFDMLSRKYTKLAELKNDKMHIGNGESRGDSLLEKMVSTELHIYTDFLRIVLEILNAILTYALSRNPEVLDFFNSRMDAQRMNGEWSVEKVLEVIIINCRSWRGEGMKMFTQLRFTYEQESHPEEFFIPYVWQLVISRRRGIQIGVVLPRGIPNGGSQAKKTQVHSFRGKKEAQGTRDLLIHSSEARDVMVCQGPGPQPIILQLEDVLSSCHPLLSGQPIWMSNALRDIDH